MLPNGAPIDDRTHAELGRQAVREVLGSLWPGDCQSCGQSLGSEPPALLVDDLQVVTRASLHHPSCRAPAWNDTGKVHTAGGVLLTWRTVPLVLPFDTGSGELRIAGLLVNPGLEEVWLKRDGDAWHPCLEEVFPDVRLTPAEAGFRMGWPVPGIAGRLTQASLGAVITGRDEMYETEASQLADARARTRAGRVPAHRDPGRRPGAPGRRCA